MSSGPHQHRRRQSHHHFLGFQHFYSFVDQLKTVHLTPLRPTRFRCEDGEAEPFQTMLVRRIHMFLILAHTPLGLPGSKCF